MAVKFALSIIIKRIKMLLLLILSFLLMRGQAVDVNQKNMKSIYDVAIHDIEGKFLDLSKFKGKKLIIVNVASECGYTPQYEGLQELYEKYGEEVAILGVPCNDFGGQEPGTEKQIQEFCTMTFGVTFPMTEKVGIKENRHPLYDWLCTKELNSSADNEVAWNFHKFLIDEEGHLIYSYPSKVAPMDQKIIDWIKS